MMIAVRHIDLLIADAAEQFQPPAPWRADGRAARARGDHQNGLDFFIRAPMIHAAQLG
jgi:hypothetical protein